METLLIQNRWRWLGHVLHKPSEDKGWTPEGKRKRGRPKTIWRRIIENELKERGYTWGTIVKKSQQQRRVEETCPPWLNSCAPEG
jgi:hypothetical protein